MFEERELDLEPRSLDWRPIIEERQPLRVADRLRALAAASAGRADQLGGLSDDASELWDQLESLRLRRARVASELEHLADEIATVLRPLADYLPRIQYCVGLMEAYDRSETDLYLRAFWDDLSAGD